MAAKRAPKPPPTLLRSTDPNVRRFVAAKKVETRLVGRVDRMLLAEQIDPTDEDYRRSDVLHPSEISKSDWCPRASFHQISLVRSGGALPRESVSMRLETIFEEGHEIHAKWQRWAWRIGNLVGIFDCLRCDHRWWDQSPDHCPSCHGPRRALRYREVPVDGEEQYLILGHGDGILRDADESDAVLEVKSMSVGTVRREWPQGMGKHSKTYDLLDGSTHKCFDLDALWRDIKRPFPSHLRQGNIYAHILGLSDVVFLYEHKGNQAYKEFRVKCSESIWGPIISNALDVKWALEKDKPPSCPEGRGGCKYCTPYEDKDTSGTRQTGHDQDQAHRAADGDRDHRGQDAAGVGGPVAVPPTRARRPQAAGAARRPDGTRGLGADVSVPGVHSVVRLPRRPTRTG